jgi:hypothetical protein
MTMESIRQMLGTIFIALADAAGDGVLDDACETITRACNSGGVDDVYARSALQALVRSCKAKAEAA